MLKDSVEQVDDLVKGLDKLQTEYGHQDITLERYYEASSTNNPVATNHHSI